MDLNFPVLVLFHDVLKQIEVFLLQPFKKRLVGKQFASSLGNHFT